MIKIKFYIQFVFCFFWGLFIIVPFSSKAQNDHIQKYIFLGHCYMHWNNGGTARVDERVQQLDFSGYSVRMLGGDVTPQTFFDIRFLEHVDSVFDIKSESTLWALGNHDYLNGNVDWLIFKMGHETYYTRYFEGVSFIVFDSSLNPSDCERLNDQFKMVKSVCDTISESSDLIMIFHHGIWSGISGVKNPNLVGHTHLPYYNANCNSSDSNFKNAIYPLLVNVQNRGIGVYCIMGDAGANINKYAQKSDDGVTFMASGINRSAYFNNEDELAKQPDDLLLEFKYDTEKRKLDYQFISLDSLLNSQH